MIKRGFSSDICSSLLACLPDRQRFSTEMDMDPTASPCEAALLSSILHGLNQRVSSKPEIHQHPAGLLVGLCFHQPDLQSHKPQQHRQLYLLPDESEQSCTCMLPHPIPVPETVKMSVQHTTGDEFRVSVNPADDKLLVFEVSHLARTWH